MRRCPLPPPPRGRANREGFVKIFLFLRAANNRRSRTLPGRLRRQIEIGAT